MATSLRLFAVRVFYIYFFHLLSIIKPKISHITSVSRNCSSLERDGKGLGNGFDERAISKGQYSIFLLEIPEPLNGLKDWDC